MTSEATQIGAVIAVVLASFELIKFFVNKYTPKTVFNGTGLAILGELKKQNENEMVHLQITIDKLCDAQINGNSEIIKAINENGRILSEIKGVLNRK